MQRTAVDPQRLTLELTESMLLSDAHEAVQKMTDLRAMGVKFSLDDFGTGYSSLTYLKLLPLEYLKIDQSFVRDVLSDPNDAAIARTVLALGASLGLRVVAEGVETQGQREFLLSNGCRLFQGYLFGKPTPIGNLALEGPGPTA
jgi:EAL domain-containing protein (putative c-di-GMP-specific phosphodiesterase class I)